MVVRKRKRRNKMLGQRTRGKGDTKKRRGAGSRGGRGMAGSHKHKYSKYYKRFGKEKKKLHAKKDVKATNIEQIVQTMPKLLAGNKVAEQSGMLVVDGTKIGFDKLLSRGSPGNKWIVRNIKASKKAVEKIKKAGGRFEQPPAKEQQAQESIEKKERKEEKKEKAAKEKKASQEKKAKKESPPAKQRQKGPKKEKKIKKKKK